MAEKARAELDGYELRGGRYLRVRMACHSAAIKVKYLSPYISNELLEQTFSMFGEVEKAVVIVDDKGKPCGEGIVEFARKQSAFNALKRISEGVFLMTRFLHLKKKDKFLSSNIEFHYSYYSIIKAFIAK